MLRSALPTRHDKVEVCRTYQANRKENTNTQSWSMSRAQKMKAISHDTLRQGRRVEPETPNRWFRSRLQGVSHAELVLELRVENRSRKSNAAAKTINMTQATF